MVIFRLQILALVVTVWAILLLPLKFFILTLIGYFLFGCVGGTVTYHRLLSHKSFKTKPLFYKVGSLLGCFSASGSPIAWVANHRKHHRFVDSDKDPHSPQHKSFWYVQLFSMFAEVQPKYAVDLMRDPYQVWLHKHYESIVYLTWAAVGLVFGLPILASLFIVPAFLVWHGGSLVNNLGHLKTRLSGKKKFSTGDNSQNVPLLGVLVWGEGWHNNHHRCPSSPYLGNKGQLDIGSWVVDTVRIK